MKLHIQTLTFGLTLSVILLAGCSGCGQETAPTADAPAVGAEDGYWDKDGEWVWTTKGYWDEDGIWRWPGKGTDPSPKPNKPRPVPEVVTPPPVLTPDELPDAFPDTLTGNNRHIWETLVAESVKSPQLFQKLLPETKERALEIYRIFGNIDVSNYRNIFEKSMWRKLAAHYPNDPEVLYFHASHFYVGHTDTSREQKLAGIAVWERIKKLYDEQGIPITSRQKTYGLSQAYIDVGEYEKAVENIFEQQERIAALRRAGITDRSMHYGLVGPGMVNELNRRIREAKEKQVIDQDR